MSVFVAPHRALLYNSFTIIICYNQPQKRRLIVMEKINEKEQIRLDYQSYPQEK
jgi:hypothetical protein